MLELLTYPPVLKGFALLCITGLFYPLAGVYIVRMNLLPVRFLLMHGVLLGGAFAVALNWNSTLVIVLVNILIIILLHGVVKKTHGDYGHFTMFFMAASIAGASIIMSKFNVPAKDTLTLLWGSLYTVDIYSIASAVFISIVLIVFTGRNFKKITAIFHDKDIALSMGINVRLYEFTIIFIITLVVASAMKLMGALLIDVLLLLPVIIAGLFSTSLKKLIVYSSMFGCLFSITGFFLSVYTDIPISAGVTIPAVLVFVTILILKRH